MMNARKSGVSVAKTSGSMPPSLRSLVTIVAAITLLFVVASGAVGAEARQGVDGAPSAGDPYFPRLGNSGYDVSHYDIALRIEPERKYMRGTTTIELEPTVALRSFTFDFIGFDVTGVQVNGEKARFSRRDEKLRITPANVLARGSDSVVRVSYKGSPDNPRKANGWLWFEGGGALFDPQPSGARTLFPCNDHPEDKASFSYDLITPRGVTAVANGLPTKLTAPDEDYRRIAWDEPERFPTYASVVAVGKFELKRQTTPDGLEIIDALPTGDADRLEDRLKRQGKMVSYFESEFGSYPYSGMGAIVLPRSLPAAMEAAGRPTYPGIQWALESDEFEQTVAHEVAHQWLGNSVTNGAWRDIWLNEGFATYAELMWISHKRDEPIGKVFRDRDVFTYPPKETSVVPGDPGPAKIFSNPVYNRGALTLEALRRKVGDEDFDEILRRWIDENRDSNVTTKEFIRLSESVSGKELDEFFHRWLYDKKRPDLPKSDG